MGLDRIAAALPWQVKLGAKLLLSRIGAFGVDWRRLGLFRHGSMDQPDYAFQVFRRHFDRSNFKGKEGGFTCLELGPGDSLFSCLIARAHGAQRTYMVDTGRYACDETPPYHEMAAYLERHGYDVSIQGARTIDDILAATGGCYGTHGVASLAELPTASIDWIWSNAVLEHVRKNEFGHVIKELHRVLKPTGVCSHQVDLKDHLGGGLNNLRFGESLWEANWMARSGFYTNRIRCSEMCGFFEAVGFEVNVLNVERWETIPLLRQKLDDAFRCLPDDELAISCFDVVLRPKRSRLAGDSGV